MLLCGDAGACDDVLLCVVTGACDDDAGKEGEGADVLEDAGGEDADVADVPEDADVPIGEEDAADAPV